MPKPLVSILLPSIRPDLFRIRMKEYARLDLPGPCEVVVVSDRSDLDVTPTHPDIAIRLFTQPRAGTIPATNLAFAKSEGDYVVAMNDETELHSQFLKALYAAGEAQNGDGLFSAVLTNASCHHDYYGIFFAIYPFGSKKFFRRINGTSEYMFDPVYHCFYADPDFSIRAHEAGFDVVNIADALCTHRNVKEADGHSFNWHTYYKVDRQTFVTRWAHLGPPPIDPSSR
jgi:GT2 family glycosyltransferase